jgi:hypothetical protein
MRSRRLALVAMAAGCAAANRPVPQPVFSQGVWHIRLDVDSAPTRLLPTRAIFGTIDFGAGRHSVELRRAIGRDLTNAVLLVAERSPDHPQSTVYKITLGQPNSFDEKIVLVGRAVTADSVVGTWSETILCCSAGGRFALWR